VAERSPKEVDLSECIQGRGSISRARLRRVASKDVRAPGFHRSTILDQVWDSMYVTRPDHMVSYSSGGKLYLPLGNVRYLL